MLLRTKKDTTRATTPSMPRPVRTASSRVRATSRCSPAVLTDTPKAPTSSPLATPWKAFMPRAKWQLAHSSWSLAGASTYSRGVPSGSR